MKKKWILFLGCICCVAGIAYFSTLFDLFRIQQNANIDYSSSSGQLQQVNQSPYDNQQIIEPFEGESSNLPSVESESSDVTTSPVIPNDTPVKLDIGGGESLEFDNLEDAKQWMQQEQIASLRARGASEQTTFIVQESWSLNQKDEITGLDQWLSRYDGTLFEPPVVFDATDDHKSDFSDPIQSLRSYLSAMHHGDAKTLLANSDESALKRLRGHFGVNETQNRDAYFSDPANKYTVFFSGKTKISGDEYVLLFYRREAAEHPKENIFFLHTTFFKRSGNSYVLSEAPRGSQFADVLTVMGANHMYTTGPYQQFSEVLKNSKMPERFYIIK